MVFRSIVKRAAPRDRSNSRCLPAGSITRARARTRVGNARSARTPVEMYFCGSSKRPNASSVKLSVAVTVLVGQSPLRGMFFSQISTRTLLAADGFASALNANAVAANEIRIEAARGKRTMGAYGGGPLT